MANSSSLFTSFAFPQGQGAIVPPSASEQCLRPNNRSNFRKGNFPPCLFFPFFPSLDSQPNNDREGHGSCEAFAFPPRLVNEENEHTNKKYILLSNGHDGRNFGGACCSFRPLVWKTILMGAREGVETSEKKDRLFFFLIGHPKKSKEHSAPKWELSSKFPQFTLFYVCVAANTDYRPKLILAGNQYWPQHMLCLSLKIKLGNFWLFAANFLSEQAILMIITKMDSNLERTNIKNVGQERWRKTF